MVTSLLNSSVMKPVLKKNYPTIRYGKGIYLYDTEDKKYLDGCSGAIVSNLGHGLEEIAMIAYKQISKVAFTYRTQFTNEPVEELGRALTDLSFSLKYSFFSNSGSEATETALRLAIQYWREKGHPKKNIILSRQISYHGVTLGALSMSGSDRRLNYEEILSYQPAIPTPYCYRCPLGKNPDSCHLECTDSISSIIEEIGPQNIAGIIMEPIVGASGGAITPKAGYYERVREICDQFDLLLIGDEVMTGIGRTGRWLGIHHWGVEPDILALGKGISAGYTPISAVLFNERVYKAIHEGSGTGVFGHTYSGNPSSAAISLGVLDYVKNHDLVHRVERLEATFSEKLHSLKSTYSFIGDVRGKGLLWGIEFVMDSGTLKTFPRELHIADQLVDIAFQKGLLIYPVKNMVDYLEGDAILVAPPFTITMEEIEKLFHLLERSLKELQTFLIEKGTIICN